MNIVKFLLKVSILSFLVACGTETNENVQTASANSDSSSSSETSLIPVAGQANASDSPAVAIQRIEPERPTGVVVPGTVRNFSPVTDAMLADPSPNDWLMLRGNYQAWSFSELDQINSENVGNLRLEWMWNMHEGDGEPAPLVYNGVIYLINTSNIIQALDGKTGELIWEHHAGPFDSEDKIGRAHV